MQWIIDDFGRTFRSGSQELTNSLGYTTGGPAVELYAIENIGHIGITERRGRAHIQCRPAIMSDKAIAGLFYWLLDRRNAHVTISWFESIWHIERPMLVPVAMAFLSHLLERRTAWTGAAEKRFLTEPSVAAQQIWQTALQDVLPRLRKHLPDHVTGETLNARFHGRWTVFELNANAKAARIRDRGNGYPPVFSGMSGPHKTFDFQKIGDGRYRDWISTNLAHVAELNQPQFENVDALISWPRIGLSRTRYWRIVVPVMRNHTTCRLLSVSGNDSGINLRPDLVQKHA